VLCREDGPQGRRDGCDGRGGGWGCGRAHARG
jgi:hypothetical protein